MQLTKEALQAAAKEPLPIEPFTIPELNLDGWMIGLSGTERDAWEKSLVIVRKGNVIPNTDNVRARFLVRVLCDENRKRLLSDADADWLGNLPAAVLAPLYEQAQRLSKMTKEDLDELGKGSAPEAGNDSSSNSH